MVFTNALGKHQRINFSIVNINLSRFFCSMYYFWVIFCVAISHRVLIWKLHHFISSFHHFMCHIIFGSFLNTQLIIRTYRSTILLKTFITFMTKINETKVITAKKVFCVLTGYFVYEKVTLFRNASGMLHFSSFSSTFLQDKTFKTDLNKIRKKNALKSSK